MQQKCAVKADPNGSSRFVVGSGSELRMYQWMQEGKQDLIKTNAVVSELAQLRTFAWSKDDLFACGLATGRTILLRLDGSTSVSHPSTLSTQINPRHSRPCNVVQFSPERRELLVVGLEKARGESLLVYDIEASARALAGVGAKDVVEHRPLVSFSASETVTSATFLSGSLLLASLGGKWIRGFDLRAPGGAVVTYATRALYGLTANPSNSHQFASFAEDGIIKLWDTRKQIDSVLSFSEADAGALGSKSRSNASKSIVEISWSPSRSGMLASLEMDSSKIRVWNLVDGPLAIDVEAANKTQDGALASASNPSEPMRLPVLLYDQSPPQFRTSLTSFAFAISPNPSPYSTSFVGVSREGGNPGTSGHRIEILPLLDNATSTFFEQGLVISSDFHPSGIKKITIPSSTREEEGYPVASTSKLAEEDHPGRSIGVEYLHRDRNETPRPSAGVRQASRTRGEERIQSENLEEELSRGMAALGKDPSVVLRERVLLGYGSNALMNASLFESPLSEFWTWISRAESLAPENLIGTFDLRFVGVLGILSSSTRPSGDTSRDEGRSRVSDKDRSAAALVARRRIENIFTISSTMSAQRKLALHSIGPQYEEDFKTVCERLQRKGDHEGAARHALLSGHLETAMGCLRACEDERLRLLAPILAAYLATKDTSSGGNSVYADLCRSLSSDGDTPWIRAMFAYLGSGGDWRELIDEGGLPLADRVAVAVR